MKGFLEFVGAVAALVVVLGYFGVRPSPAEAKATPPAIVPAPSIPEPDAARKRRPKAHRTGLESKAPDGTEPAVDYPPEFWFPNIGSQVNGAGMCVFTAAEFSFIWAGLDEFRGFRDWAAAKYPGGGYPEKLAKLVKEYCALKHIPTARFNPDRDLVQYVGTDFTWIERCLKNGWLPGCSLYHSDRYKPAPIIYHMTNCAHLDAKEGAILDNNGSVEYEWSPREKWQKQVVVRNPQTGEMQYWGFAVVTPGPPPAPTN